MLLNIVGITHLNPNTHSNWLKLSWRERPDASGKEALIWWKVFLITDILSTMRFFFWSRLFLVRHNTCQSLLIFYFDLPLELAKLEVDDSSRSFIFSWMVSAFRLAMDLELIFMVSNDFLTKGLFHSLIDLCDQQRWVRSMRNNVKLRFQVIEKYHQNGKFNWVK